MAAVTKSRRKPREIISRKVHFLGKFLTPVLDEVTMLRMRSHIRLSKGYKTKLRLTTTGISMGAKSTSFIRGKLPYEFTPFVDIRNLYIDQTYRNILLRVSPYSGGQTEIVAYKFQEDMDANLFHQFYCELTDRPTRNAAVPVTSRSGFVEFDSLDRERTPPPVYEAGTNWMFSPPDGSERGPGKHIMRLSNGFYMDDAITSVSQQSSGRHHRERSHSTGRQRTLQEAVESRAAFSLENERKNHDGDDRVKRQPLSVANIIARSYSQQQPIQHDPSSETMHRDIDQISKELQEIRTLLRRGDEQSLLEVRQRIYQTPVPSGLRSDGGAIANVAHGPGHHPASFAGPVRATVADYRRSNNRPDHSLATGEARVWTGPQSENYYTGTGQAAPVIRQSRGVARNLPAHIRSRSNDSHKRYTVPRSPSADSRSSGGRRHVTAMVSRPLGRMVSPVDQDRVLVYPSATKVRSHSANRYKLLYKV